MHFVQFPLKSHNVLLLLCGSNLKVVSLRFGHQQFVLKGVQLPPQLRVPSRSRFSGTQRYAIVSNCHHSSAQLRPLQLLLNLSYFLLKRKFLVQQKSYFALRLVASLGQSIPFVSHLNADS